MKTKLEVKRRFRGANYTIGTLYVNGERFCDTLEDTDRGLNNDMTQEQVRGIKVPGHTAIPTGSYEVAIDFSPRFRRPLPRLQQVPGFTGVLIHAGNSHRDTSGCILVGENKQKGMVLNSRYWEDELMKALDGSESITLTIG